MTHSAVNEKVMQNIQQDDLEVQGSSITNESKNDSQYHDYRAYISLILIFLSPYFIVKKKRESSSCHYTFQKKTNLPHKNKVGK